MLRIAVTGGIACGKSLVGKLLAAQGAVVCDADDIVHQLLADDKGISRKITREFGPHIVTNRGQIDRSALGRIVFEDDDARQKLNALIHPAVKTVCRAWMEARENEGKPLAVLIVPLLYEAEMHKGWDAVICVASGEPTQIQRLLARGLSRHEAHQRIAAQMPLQQKMSMADFVLFNNSTQAVLEQQITSVMNRILEK